MYRHLRSLGRVLRRGGRCAYVVGDQRTYLQTYTPTGKILSILAEQDEVGLQVEDVLVWRVRKGTTGSGEKIKEEIVKILKDEGFVSNYRVIDEKPAPTLRVYLKYGPDKVGVLQRIERVSRPGRRVYADKDSVPRIISGLGVAVISTSQGILTDRECRKRSIGGEVLLRAW